MNELTIEQKAQRYDKALEVAKDIRNGEATYIPNGTPVIDAIFPELKGSEDDKIRKNCIHFLELQKQHHAATFEIEECIAWLEKQGEKPQGKSALESIEEEKVDNRNCAKSFARYKVGDTIYYDSFGRLVSFTIANIVEDGTDNPMYEDKDGNSVFQNDIVEQEPADKVESKFHEGEWIIGDKDNTVHQVKSAIKNVSNGKYAYDLIDGGYISTSHESDYHLWTIKDAKDGDVLIFEGFYNSIVLFQGIGINGKGRINYHCKCDLGDYSFGVQGDVACLGTIEKDAEHYHPATKEQRDLLFQKMKEAGYEWDAEKKELEKLIWRQKK